MEAAAPSTFTGSTIAAVAVFGAAGALAAARRKHDIVTFGFFAAVTGVGGGTAARPADRRAGVLGGAGLDYRGRLPGARRRRSGSFGAGRNARMKVAAVARRRCGMAAY